MKVKGRGEGRDSEKTFIAIKKYKIPAKPVEIMQIKIYSLPIGGDESLTEEMNHFLCANKIIDIRKELASVNGNSCWTFCITYMQTNRPTEIGTSRHGNNQKVDYKEVLEPETFDKFSNLRKLRKQIAESEAIPAYAIFTDAELAELSKLPELTLETMQKIPGIGKKKIEKYGTVFVQDQQTAESETSRISN